MVTYSAGEAIGPAWDHTRTLLFRNRRWPRILKICLVALFSQFGGLNGSFNRSSGNAHIPAGMQSVLLAVGLLIGLISLVIGLVLIYVGSRLQFVLFDILLLRDDSVAPAWRRHGTHTWRWVGVKVLFALCLGIVLSPLLIPAILGFIHLFQTGAWTLGPNQHFTFAMVSAAMLFIAEVFAVVILFVAIYRVFVTVAMPGMALEDLSFGDTYRRTWDLFRAQPSAMVVYGLLTLLVGLGLGLAFVVCLLLALVLPAVPLGLLGWALWALLHGGTAGMFFLGTLGVVAVVALALWALLVYVVGAGTLVCFYQAWALYFLAGRYPLLGQYLQGGGSEPARPLGFPEQPILGFRD